MSWLHVETMLLDVGRATVGFAVNWLLQSTLLIVAGIVTGSLLRHRGSAVQSIVYRTTLVAALVCPLASGLLSFVGLSGWSLEMPTAWTLDKRQPTLFATAESPPIDAERPDYRGQTAGEGRAIVPADEVVRWDSDRVSDDASDPTLTALPATAPADANERTAASTSARPFSVSIPVETWTFTIHTFGLMAGGFCLTWAAVSSMLLGHLAFACWHLARLRRCAFQAEPPTIQTCRELASRLGVAVPEVLRSPYFPSPCLTGLRRPAVLLPDADMNLPIRDVLAHELAHLRRRDCHWQLLWRLSSSVFFFQPLWWRLARRLEMTAEEVCDDYVVQLGGDRREYAHRLVDIAELSCARPAAVGVGIVSLRSMLANRVLRIMDTSRSLSTRAGNVLLALVIVGGLIGTFAVGFVGVGTRRSMAEITPFENVKVNPGEEKDLGDIVIGASGPTSSGAEDAKQAAESKSPKVAVMGQVTGVDGQPVAGVHIAAIGWNLQPARGGDLVSGGQVLAQGTNDQQGRYNLTLRGVSSKTHSYANVIARKDGAAIAWQTLDLDAPHIEAPLELSPEELIRGRLVDIEGQPAAGVRLQVRGIMQRGGTGQSREGVGYRGKDIPAAWLAPITCDSQGRFTIHGVPAGHGVYLDVEGNDRFAPQDIALNTGMSEQRGERDATYRSLVRNVPPGEEAVLPLAPAQLFEGFVQYEDTGEVVPHARLSIWASQQPQFGSMVSVGGAADAEGRYRIRPKPGVRFGVTAYPPDGVPYLIRQTSEAIRWETGDRVKQVDLTLPRGVLVRGKVVTAGASAPLSNVSIQYIPEEANNPRASSSILTGWQGIQISNPEGQFQIAVLPGPGWLIAHASDGSYVVQEIGSSQLSQGKAGGARNYAHAFVKLDPQPDAESIDVTIELQPGARVAGRIVDELGQPVNEALVITRLAISLHDLWWRGHKPPVLGGQFELTGLKQGVEYPTFFLDAKRRLGATAILKAGDPEPTVGLRPCGTAHLRIVDGEGQPVANYYPNIEMVVTPGTHRYDVPSMRLGLLAADSDFISNIDRANYPSMPKSDPQGNVTLPALIPGATYRVAIPRDGKFQTAKDFQPTSNETLELGDIAVERPD